MNSPTCLQTILFLPQRVRDVCSPTGTCAGRRKQRTCLRATDPLYTAPMKAVPVWSTAVAAASRYLCGRLTKDSPRSVCHGTQRVRMWRRLVERNLRLFFFRRNRVHVRRRHSPIHASDTCAFVRFSSALTRFSGVAVTPSPVASISESQRSSLVAGAAGLQETQEP